MNHAGSQSAGIQMAEAQHIGYGQRRKSLEDRCTSRVVHTAGGLTLHVGIAADGIGGANAGEAASQLALNSILHSMQHSQVIHVNTILRNALLTAHQEVQRAVGTNINLRAMGTTLTVTAIHEGRLYIAHVGNSRAYLVREGMIQQLTLDHTWGNEKLRLRQYSPEEVANHPRKDELARYLGIPITMDVDIGLRLDYLNPATSQLFGDGYPLQAGDVVVLCTDGLVKERRGVGGFYVEAEEIATVVSQNSGQEAANTLVSLALGRQVDDNVSVVILEMPGKKTKTKLPFGLNTRIILIALAVIGVFLMVGIAFAGLLPLFLTSPEPTAAPTATEFPGFVFVTSNQGSGQYFSPGKNPEPLVGGAYAPIEAGTSINVHKGPFKLDTRSGLILYIGDNTIVTIDQLADPSSGTQETNLSLESGAVLVRLAGGAATVKFQNGLSAQVSGSIMGADYLSPTDFALDCFEGACTLYEGEGDTVGSLIAPEYVLVEDGVMSELDVSRNNPRIQRWIDVLGVVYFSELGISGSASP